MSKFTFDKDTHAYKLNGKRLTGVTTILNVIAKPALIPWAVNMAVDYLKKNSLGETSFVVDSESGSTLNHCLIVPQSALEESKSAHRLKKEEAGDIGTQVHQHIEDYINARIKGEIHEPKFESEQVSKMFAKFVEWAVEEKITFLLSEQKLYSEKHWFAGTCDIVFEKDGKKYIGDVKTARDIYETNYIQMGGYHICLEELGKLKDCEGYCVINIPKQFKASGEAKIKVKYLYNPEECKTAFLNALGLYRFTNKEKK